LETDERAVDDWAFGGLVGLEDNADDDDEDDDDADDDNDSDPVLPVTPDETNLFEESTRGFIVKFSTTFSRNDF